MNIVFATAEVSPIAKTGGLGDVCGALPKALRKLGHDVAVFLPFYRQARQWLERNGASVYQVLPTETIVWGNWAAEATYLRTNLPGTDIPLILVANDYFFERDQIYSGLSNGTDDYLLRYVFFNRAIVRACELLGLKPDILHCHDWHTALLPVYLHSGLRSSDVFRDTRSVYTIHNLMYQGVAGPDAFALTGLHSRYWAPDGIEHFGTLNPMKGGILYADQVTTVSPNYGREIRTSEYGAGLDGVLRLISFKFQGILNGIDVEEWDPRNDPLLAASYDAGSLDGKTECKRALVEEAGFRFDAKAPLIGAVSRLVGQKGFQICVDPDPHHPGLLDKLIAAGAQVVILGSGEAQLENALAMVGERHPDHARVWIGFDNELAHRIYAGCDALLMPSVYEPCGLNQMYALRYGTLPIVRMTGGLADTVIPFDGTNEGEANGFGFVTMHPADLYTANLVALLTYRDPGLWKSLQAHGMAADFSWERSARQYDEVYRRTRSI